MTIKNLNIINGNAHQTKNYEDDNEVDLENLSGGGLSDANKLFEYLYKFLDSKSNKLIEGLGDARHRIDNLTSQLNDTQAIAKKLADELDAVNQLMEDLYKRNDTKSIEEIADARQKIDNLTSQLHDTQAVAKQIIDEMNAANQQVNNLIAEFVNSTEIKDLLYMDAKGKTINGNGQELIFNITTPAEVLIENLSMIDGNAYQADNNTDANATDKLI